MSVMFRAAARGPLAVACVLPLVLAAAAWPHLARAADVPVSANADAETPPPPAHEDDPVQIQEVIIQAAPLGRTSDELVQPVEVLSGEELARKKAPTIGETLSSEPGISSTNFGVAASRPIIRGQDGPRVQVLENGIGSLDVSDVSPDHAVTISPASATQIEVIKGPSSLLYGSGAAGGIVNITNTRLPTTFDPGTHGNLESYYASNADQRSVTMDVDSSLGEGSMVHADYGYSKAGDFDLAGPANADGSGPRKTLPNSDSENQMGALSYGYVFGNDSSAAVSISRMLSTYGLPNEETAFIKMDQTRYDGQLLLNRPLEGIDSVKLRGAFNDYQHTEFEGPGEPGTKFTNREHQERLEIVHTPIAGWRGVLGLNHDQRSFAAIGEEAVIPVTDIQSLGLFVVEERPVSFGRLELGGRVERVQLDPDDEPYKHFALANVSAGVVFDVTEADHVKLYASRAQRAPSPEELFAYGPHIATAAFERGLSDAKVESGNNIEIGFDHHRDRWTLNASLWYERFQNYLYLDTVDEGLNADGSGSESSDGVPDTVDEEGEYDPDGELTLYDYHQEDAKFWGYELSTEYALVQQAPWTLNLRLFTDSVRAELSDGDNLPRIAPRRYGIGAHGSWQEIHANLDYTRVASADHLSDMETPTSGYNMLSADLSYHFRVTADAPESEVYLRGRNLLDENARSATSFIKDSVPLPGLSVMAGVRLSY